MVPYFSYKMNLLYNFDIGILSCQKLNKISFPCMSYLYRYDDSPVVIKSSTVKRCILNNFKNKILRVFCLSCFLATLWWDFDIICSCSSVKFKKLSFISIQKKCDKSNNEEKFHSTKICFWINFITIFNEYFSLNWILGYL